MVKRYHVKDAGQISRQNRGYDCLTSTFSLRKRNSLGSPLGIFESRYRISRDFFHFRIPRSKTMKALSSPPQTGTLLTTHAILLSDNRITKSQFATGVVSVAVAISSILILLLRPLRDPDLPLDDIGDQSQEPSIHQRSPEDNLSLLQFLTVSWMSPLIRKGKLAQLNEENVWLLPWDFQHTRLHEQFRDLKGSVIARLLRANGVDLVVTTCLNTIEVVANLTAPVLLQQLLRAMENKESPRQSAITYAALILTVRLIAGQASVLNLWFSRRCYERARGEMITMLYEKTLNRKIIGINPEFEVSQHEVSGDEDTKNQNQSLFKHTLNKIRGRSRPQSQARMENSKPPASMGKILNLMRNDVYEVAQRFWEFPNIITKPLGLIISVVLVWKLIGWPCLLGITTVIFVLSVNAFIAMFLLKIEKKRRKATDAKLQMTSQFVESIRHLRWYGWTSSWLERILASRQVELKLRVITNTCGTMIGFLNVYAAELFPVVAFFAYTSLAGQALKIDIAFPALQLFVMLQENLRQLPDLFLVLLNAFIAMGRIEQFMKEPNKDEEDEQNQECVLHLPSKMSNASFCWPGQSTPVLKDITITLPEGLTLVHGKVGAGKSALLQAFLGELDKVNGTFAQNRRMVGYCTQTPWLQSMSIRENILFGSEFNPSRYRQVLDACQLTVDLANFKFGDLSNVGENGIGLSGGQRARVALARAIYSTAGVLFLDDPVSALDHQTAERLVDACFSGPLMKDRTVVLVTHRVDLCQPYAEQLIEIVEGRAKVHDKMVFNSIKFFEEAEHNQEPVHELTKAQQDAAVPDKFIEDEGRARGGVRLSVYWEYVKAGRLRWWCAMVFIMGLGRLSSVVESWFLKQWGEAYDEPHETTLQLHQSGSFLNLPSPEQNINAWLICFFLIATAQAVAFLVAMIFVIIIVYISGRRMFTDIMRRVSYATFRFYDTTPVGRLMNRLTSDISTLDGNISHQLGSIVYLTISWISSILIIGSVTPAFLLFAVMLTAAFVFVFTQFLPTSQSLRRLEMVSLSPLMSNFGALLEGLTTVRAFQAQSRFQKRVINVVDTFQRMDHFYWSLQAWLQYRFDALSASSTLILTLLALSTGVSPGLTAFVLIAAEKFVNATHELCKQYGQLQLEFVAVERVVELLYLDQEHPGTLMPSATWPSFSGNIVFENVTIRYAPHLDPALSDLSFTIQGGTSTAILGRTGSGKSTLALALLATIVPESGRILIDGVDINEVDKQSLRSRITFLAQDPILFPGSLRHNLDPLDEHSDDECAKVLARIAANHQWRLDLEIDTAGKNLSQGQRQLIGLARVLLRRSPIVILDEATASIDMGTAMHVQEVLRQEMSESTVITIAHRLEAVKGADCCVVLGKGRIIEMGNTSDALKEGAS
ncbi:hypothetical protein FH972_026213 [Carpinus fangiana]|uniref:ABC-type xenobiotic transporter n=1 Tax=Carpinus fangiana TaxID=176857 RepID=A0A5N6L3A8_9ROSI|nr:hypothetical protein FH972_026213 [Carpinus fangiana]